MTEQNDGTDDEGDVHIGDIDGAKHFIYVVEHDDRYQCPDCGTQPIDWDGLREELWTLSATQIWNVVPSSTGNPNIVFEAIETAIEELGLQRQFVIEDATPRCTVCGTAYDITLEDFS